MIRSSMLTVNLDADKITADKLYTERTDVLECDANTDANTLAKIPMNKIDSAVAVLSMIRGF